MRVRSWFILIGGCAALGGCLANDKPAPVTFYGATQGAGSAGVHTVSGRETLYDISKRYNIVMRDIVVSNNLSAPFRLSSGQRLKLPPPQTYTARAGDTLYQVSRLFGVDSTEVARLNNIPAPYALPPGTRLKLPSVTPQTSPYVVQTAIYAPSVPVAPVSAEPLEPLEPLVGKMAALPTKKPDVPSDAQPAPKTRLAGVPPPRASSRFLTPVQGKVVSAYGPKDNGLHNDGMNIAAPKGAPVSAADNGVVVYAGNELKGSGNLVLVRHADRWMTAYAHLDQIKVARGDVIKRGQKIGTVGDTGSVNTPQLHFEVRRGTEAINPKRYLES